MDYPSENLTFSNRYGCQTEIDDSDKMTSKYPAEDKNFSFECSIEAPLFESFRETGSVERSPVSEKPRIESVKGKMEFNDKCYGDLNFHETKLMSNDDFARSLLGDFGWSPTECGTSVPSNVMQEEDRKVVGHLETEACEESLKDKASNEALTSQKNAAGQHGSAVLEASQTMDVTFSSRLPTSDSPITAQPMPEIYPNGSSVSEACRSAFEVLAGDSANGINDFLIDAAGDSKRVIMESSYTYNIEDDDDDDDLMIIDERLNEPVQVDDDLQIDVANDGDNVPTEKEVIELIESSRGTNVAFENMLSLFGSESVSQRKSRASRKFQESDLQELLLTCRKEDEVEEEVPPEYIPEATAEEDPEPERFSNVIQLSESDDDRIKKRRQRTVKRRRIRRNYCQDEGNTLEKGFEDYMSMSFCVKRTSVTTQIDDQNIVKALAERIQKRRVAKDLTALTTAKMAPGRLSAAETLHRRVRKYAGDQQAVEKMFEQLKVLKDRLTNAKVKRLAASVGAYDLPINPIEHMILRSRHPGSVSGRPRNSYSMTSLLQVLLIKTRGHISLQNFAELPYRGYMFHKIGTEADQMAEHLNRLSKWKNKVEEDIATPVINMVKQKLAVVKGLEPSTVIENPMETLKDDNFDFMTENYVSFTKQENVFTPMSQISNLPSIIDNDPVSDIVPAYCPTAMEDYKPYNITGFKSENQQDNGMIEFAEMIASACDLFEM